MNESESYGSGFEGGFGLVAVVPVCVVPVKVLVHATFTWRISRDKEKRTCNAKAKPNNLIK